MPQGLQEGQEARQDRLREGQEEAPPQEAPLSGGRVSGAAGRAPLALALGGALAAVVLLAPVARAETVYMPAPAPSAPAPPALPPPGTPNTKLSRTRINAGHGTAQFTFYGVGAVGGFECALVKRVEKRHRKHPSFRPCGSPQGYRGLGSGHYLFKARAYGPGGFDKSPAALRFTITRGSRRR